jgi:TRAP-type uncharacterized transport system fused permease subunit
MQYVERVGENVLAISAAQGEKLYLDGLSASALPCLYKKGNSYILKLTYYAQTPVKASLVIGGTVVSDNLFEKTGELTTVTLMYNADSAAKIAYIECSSEGTVYLGELTISAFVNKNPSPSQLEAGHTFVWDRNVTIKGLYKTLFDSVKTTAVIEYLVCVSGIMGYVMSYTKIPALVASAILGMTDNQYVILLIMNVILLIVGCFMDPTPAVLIFTPIFLPIVQTWGMSAVHFGLMMVMNLCVGTLTPPVGAILFAGCRTHGVKIEQIIKPLLPFFAVIFLILMLITYVPILSEFIPKMLGLM